MPDQMDLGACDAQFAQPIALGFELLHAILAEEGDARANCFCQSLRGMHFRNTHQLHIFTRAARAMTGRRYALFDFTQSVGKGTHASMVGEGVGEGARRADTPRTIGARTLRIQRKEVFCGASGVHSNVHLFANSRNFWPTP